MSDANCPYCGEPEETDTPTGITIYRCGTLIYPNGSSVTPLICDLGRDLRREREAHNNTKRERDEAREAFVIATDQMVRAQCNLRDSCREAGEAIFARDEAREENKKLKEALIRVRTWGVSSKNFDASDSYQMAEWIDDGCEGELPKPDGPWIYERLEAAK